MPPEGRIALLIERAVYPFPPGCSNGPTLFVGGETSSGHPRAGVQRSPRAGVQSPPPGDRKGRPYISLSAFSFIVVVCHCGCGSCKNSSIYWLTLSGCSCCTQWPLSGIRLISISFTQRSRPVVSSMPRAISRSPQISSVGALMRVSDLLKETDGRRKSCR